MITIKSRVKYNKNATIIEQVDIKKSEILQHKDNRKIL
jgi:hypothetical protein